MAKKDEWPKELTEILRKHWQNAKNDRDEFWKLVESDRFLMKQKSLGACRKKAEALDFFKDAKISKKKYPFSQFDEAKKQELLKLLADGNVGWEEVSKKFPGFSELQFRNFARSQNVGINKKKNGKEKQPILVKRNWPEPKIIEISKEQWDKPGTRVAYISLGQYLKEGWRCGLFELVGTIIAQEGVHFPVFAGGIVNKDGIQAELKRLQTGVSRKFFPVIFEHTKSEIVEALKSILPHFKDPAGKFTRWYIMTSLPFDGPFGEEIIRMFQEKRPEDIRQYRTGGEKIEVKQAGGKPSIYHGVVLSKRGRLSSKYMSARVERDIEDVEEQTSRDYPDLWVHGTSATALYKPSGERIVPYISLPGLQKLEADDKKIAENQIGLTIVEDMPDGDRLVHMWSFRDLIAREREFITGIKEGSSELHKKIVDIIKREGARHPGRLADELAVEREKLDKEIKFLLESKRSSRLTWPGLRYDEASQRYDFHTDWIQELLRYQLPKDKDGWHEDSFLFFGCMHAGYTTTDYEFIVNKFPEIILKYDIKVLGGIGDFIAGLHHSFMHKGEILHLNNTEQEEFAGELLATVIFKVFTARFEKNLEKYKDYTPNTEELSSLIDTSLLLFLIKKGNHDRWQEYDGNTALVKFVDTINRLLLEHIRTLLAIRGFKPDGLTEILRKKIIMLPEFHPVFSLPSGINTGLIHPNQARAETTSLRVEKALKHFERFNCQVVGVANFHVATFAHKWRPRIGQCVGAQTGTEVILTDFEYNKLKSLDFGPLYLRVCSYKGRIFKTTQAAFSQSILKEPIPKWTDVTKLKQKLGLLGNSV